VVAYILINYDTIIVNISGCLIFFVNDVYLFKSETGFRGPIHKKIQLSFLRESGPRIAGHPSFIIKIQVKSIITSHGPWLNN